MDHELHPARFVEKPLEDDFLACRHTADGGFLSGNVADRLLRGPGVRPALGLQPVDGVFVGWDSNPVRFLDGIGIPSYDIVQSCRDVSAQTRQLAG